MIEDRSVAVLALSDHTKAFVMRCIRHEPVTAKVIGSPIGPAEQRQLLKLLTKAMTGLTPRFAEGPRHPRPAVHLLWVSQ